MTDTDEDRAYFWCPECGPGVSADEDGLCVSCGMDCATVYEPPGDFSLRSRLSAAEGRAREAEKACEARGFLLDEHRKGCAWQARAAALEALLGEARMYGHHAANCSAHEDVTHPCNCGWSKALGGGA